MIKEERFLPIGTVVLLKGGQKEVMITSYCIFPTGKQYREGKEVPKEKRIFEYGGCVYPEGIIFANSACAFNHEDIVKICHLGYENDAYKEFSKSLNDNYEEMKKEFFASTDK